MSRLRTFLSVIAIAAFSSPVSAGEITGNGTPIDVNGRSECAFSGLNDHDGDPRDPGGHTQSYGTNVGQFGLIDPQDLDPRNEAGAPFVPIPGYACNPNRGRDLHG